ncbi:MAG: tyrosine--tRNA ligase [Candidatus Staskawiczbacteria bacterium RIFCSPLOWO2_01_FULL_37_25b]|uniref:Tyrosine--tRNA ligase n=2 Tax=Candidatus Staskawicziibacteriota TaxID=1817916 RepID=A0A1G2HSE0_9BACT|nr:MAG: tyrosine--tRNA ligase [Candidatus Staskawiczbacteria bacterium RIFCSPHIGHO2_01_FULL_36_16]OGZ73625.1 MAG: tyrosine--tRNA ligase [Candidatus Staskawiczbacteria bacterium RIFCSPLOWO2_01_FULL_37_25b]
MVNTNPQKIEEILNRGTIVEILPSKDEFKKILLSGKKLRFYIGFDATSPDLHLSHAKNIMLMEKFRQLGHETIILFGDFTARIGDPSDENSARKQLSKKQVDDNVKKWKQLIKPLMNFNDFINPPKIKYNSKWLSKLNFEDILRLSSMLTVPRLLERDMYQKRLKEGKTVFLHEFLYPLMQGYDSVAMDVDVEVCGTDQIFNALTGRDLLEKIKGKEKHIVAVTLMENPKTGELMSKSKGTGVFLSSTPNEMYGQIMAQPDEMIKILFINNTYLPLDKIEKIMASENFRNAKAKLALEIVKIYHGEKQAQKAGQEFDKVFHNKELPTDIPVFQTDKNNYFVLDLLFDAKLASSKNEAKRLVEGGGVEMQIGEKKEKISDWKKEIILEDGMVIKVGSRKFVKIKLKI